MPHSVFGMLNKGSPLQDQGETKRLGVWLLMSHTDLGELEIAFETRPADSKRTLEATNEGSRTHQEQPSNDKIAKDGNSLPSNRINGINGIIPVPLMTCMKILHR